MEIRQMRNEDYNEVYQLWMSCEGIGLNNRDDTPEGVANFLQRNPDTCLVAEIEGRIVGVVLAGTDGRRGRVYHMAVHPDSRRQGIARQLVEKALDGLKQAGVYKVSLVAFAKNQAGNGFWESMGFVARDDLVYRDKLLAPVERVHP